MASIPTHANVKKITWEKIVKLVSTYSMRSDTADTVFKVSGVVS